MRAHVIENGKVINTIEVKSLDAFPNLIDASSGGQIGDLWDDSQFSDPSLSSAGHNKNIDRQILSLEVMITERMKREALLGKEDIDPRTGRTAAQQIAYIDEQIEALRAQRI